MADTDKLSDMIDNLTKNNPEEARSDFHDYLQPKMQEILKDNPEESGNDTNQ